MWTALWQLWFRFSPIGAVSPFARPSEIDPQYRMCSRCVCLHSLHCPAYSMSGECLSVPASEPVDRSISISPSVDVCTCTENCACLPLVGGQPRACAGVRAGGPPGGLALWGDLRGLSDRLDRRRRRRRHARTHARRRGWMDGWWVGGCVDARDHTSTKRTYPFSCS